MKNRLLVSMLVAIMCVGNVFAVDGQDTPPAPDQQQQQQTPPANDKKNNNNPDKKDDKCGVMGCLKSAVSLETYTATKTRMAVTGVALLSIVGAATGAWMYRKEIQEKICGKSDAEVVEVAA